MQPDQDRNNIAWPFTLVLGLLNAADGILLLVAGGDAEADTILRVTGVSWADLGAQQPAVAHYIGNLLAIIGVLIVGLSLFVIATSLTAYRRGRRRSWYAMWLLPLYYVVTALILYSEGEIFSSDALSVELLVFFLAFAAVVQLGSFRVFFPNRRASTKPDSTA